MKYEIRSLTHPDAAEASAVIQESFLALAAADWRPEARKSFLEDTAPTPRSLWESARAQIEARFPEVHTIELNATPYAVRFYESVGFVPISSEFEREGRRAIRMAFWLPARALGANEV